jgi:hypothetical protein
MEFHCNRMIYEEYFRSVLYYTTMVCMNEFILDVTYTLEVFVYVHITLRHGPEKSACEVSMGFWGQWPRSMWWEECHVSGLTCWSNALQEGIAYAPSSCIPVSALMWHIQGSNAHVAFNMSQLTRSANLSIRCIVCLSWISGGIRGSVQNVFSEQHGWVVSFISDLNLEVSYSS